MSGTPSDSLPAFPVAAAQVLRLAAVEDVTGPELAEVIETDPALTAGVLRLANSAGKAPRVPIETTRAAATRLGVRAVARFATVVAARALHAPSGALDPALARLLFHRNLGTATAARYLAELRALPNPGTFFVAGLLRNIGYLEILRSSTGGQRSSLRLQCVDANMVDHLERSQLGRTQHDVAAELLRSWDLPTAIVELVKGGDATDREARHCLDHADQFSIACLVEARECAPHPPWPLYTPEPAVDDLAALLADIRRECEQLLLLL